MKNLLILITCLAFFSINTSAQKAILYSVDFKISSSLREEVQKTDHFGELQWKEVKGKQVPDVYLPDMSAEEVERICESFAEMIKENYDYSEIEILYPKGLDIVSSNKMSGFPNKSLKSAIRKKAADAYISLEVNIQDKNLASLFFASDQDNPNRYILFSVSSNYIIVNKAGKEIDKKSLEIVDFDELFAGKFETSINNDTYKISGLSYFTTSEMYSLYKMCESGYSEQFNIEH